MKFQFYQFWSLIGLGFLLFATISFFYLDQPMSLFFFTNKESEYVRFFKYVTDLGLALPYFLLGFLGLIIAKLLDRKKKNAQVTLHNRIQLLKNLSQNTLISLFFSGIVVLSIKMLVGRIRPYYQYSNIDSSRGETIGAFNPLTINPDFLSFPSGHAQVVFCVAVMLMFFFPRYRILLVTLAFLLALTRVATLNHFLSDIIIGSFIGIVISMVVYKKNESV